MKKLLLASTLSLSALSISTLPVQAQFVAVPVTGNFSLTNPGGGNQFVGGVPTLLTPIGTINLTSANPVVNFRAAPSGTITTNTPSSAFFSVTGSMSLNDSRTATFTNASAYVEGNASVTGAASMNVIGPDGPYLPLPALPVGATLAFTITSGALYVPAAGFSAYTTPQFDVPVTGGSFTITDPVGTAPGVITISSLLTPLGTANLTISPPTLSIDTGIGRPRFTTPNLTGRVGGVGNGTITLNDGRIATVTNQLLSLNANFVASGQPAGGTYFYDSHTLVNPVTITGTITGGSISVPESAVALPPPPVQPPVVPPPVVPPVVPPPVVPPSVVLPAPPPPRQEFVLGFATGVNLGGDPEDYLQRVEVAIPPVLPDDLPEVEQSPLAFSRIHPGCNSYTR